MKLIIEGDELAQALEAWVNKLGMDTSNKQVDVTITSGRGVNSSSATVSITESDTDSKVQPVASLSAIPDAPAIKEEEDDTDDEPVDETKVMFGSD